MELVDAGASRPPLSAGGPEHPREANPPSAVEMLACDEDAPAVDLGDGGAPAGNPHDRRRGRRTAVVGLVLAVGVATGAALTSAHDNARARTAAIAAARSTMDLRVLEVTAQPNDDGSLFVLASVRNAGPEPVVVTGARLGKVDLKTPLDPVLAGENRVATGLVAGPCAPASAVRGSLVLQVRTADGVRRTARLQPFRDFVLQADQVPGPASCQAADFGVGYVEADAVSSTAVRPHTARLVLSLTPHLGQAGQVAQLTNLGIAQDGILTKPVSALPVTVSDGEPVRVTVDVSAPRCAVVRLPEPYTGPYLWFRGRTLPHGKLTTAYTGSADSVLVAVLRLLARACPHVMTG